MYGYAYRSVKASIENASEDTLVFRSVEILWGQWAGGKTPLNEVPSNIKEIPKGTTGTFMVESASFMTGCEGTIVYTIGSTEKTFTVYWNNPFMNCAWETNDYTQKRSDGKLENAKNEDEMGDEECVCYFICRDTKIGDPVARPPTPKEQACTAHPGKETHLSACPVRTNVILVPQMSPARPTGDDMWYWFLLKWGEQWVAGAKHDERRDIVRVPMTTVTVPTAAVMTDMRKATLAAYKEAVDKQKGGGGEVIHAIGHGAIYEIDNSPYIQGAFDIAAQRLAPATHLLFASSLTFAVGEENAVVMSGGTIDNEATQREKDNYKLLQDIGSELRRGGAQTVLRILTCRIGAAPVFHQKLGNLFRTSVFAYDENISIADADGGGFDIGFIENPRAKLKTWKWEENFHKELPTPSRHEKFVSQSVAAEMDSIKR